MNIDFRQPKYILPLLLLPFLLLFFYAYHSSARPAPAGPKPAGAINSTLGEVSDDIRKRQLEDKLEAYRNTYKDADGSTAVAPVPADNYQEKQKKMLDSINTAMRQQFSGQAPDKQSSRAMIAALNHVRQEKPEEPVPKDKDPMDLFRQQMAVMDSLQKASTPKADSAAKKKAAGPTLPVTKAAGNTTGFNTLRPENPNNPIMAVIDENVTGYAGSRIRLRLLEDIVAGGTTVCKGTYLYALISGFAEQRVTLQVRSIFYKGQLLPVKMDLYDTDGLPGLYVPASAFRDFSKDLGTNTIDGVTLDGSSSFVMSTAGKMFQSTSSAIAGMIRKDKAKLKYNTYIYLINNKQ